MFPILLRKERFNHANIPLGHQRVLAHVEGVGNTWIRTYATKERAAAVAKRYHIPSQGAIARAIPIRETLEFL